MPEPSTADIVRASTEAANLASHVSHQAQSELVSLVVSDPVSFSEGILGHKLWSKQKEIMRAVAENKRVAVKACHSSGKSFLAADLMLWWITRYRDGIALCTAPTFTQVEKVLWSYIHKSLKYAKFKYPQANKTYLELGPDNYAKGLSTNEGVRFQGFKGHMLIILDEAPGVKDEIWEAIEGIRAGGEVHILAIGNPTVPSGSFFDCFTKDAKRWKTFTISAFDTPNLEGLTLHDILTMQDEQLQKKVSENLVSREWVKEKHDEWGRDYYLWQSRVLGEFPQETAFALIPYDAIDAAVAKPPFWDGTVAVGVDPSAGGPDETGVTVRSVGRPEQEVIIEVVGFSGKHTENQVSALLDRYGKHRVSTVTVDGDGTGFYFAEILKTAGWPVTVFRSQSGKTSSDKFFNRRAEKYWHLRQLFVDHRITGLQDRTLIEQLRRVRNNPDSPKILIQSKAEIKRLDHYSPDRADSLMYACAYGDSIQHHIELAPSSVKTVTGGLMRMRF